MNRKILSAFTLFFLMATSFDVAFANETGFETTDEQYIKIANDLEKQFGKLSHKHIVEIGGSCGSQCKVISDLFGFASYTIVDSSEHLELTKKHLSEQGIQNVLYVNLNELNSDIPADLLICNHSFSGFSESEQQLLIDKIINLSASGYMSLKTDDNDPTAENLVGNLIRNVKRGKLATETSSNKNEILSWKPLHTDTPKISPLANWTNPQLQNGIQSRNAITYVLNGGRLGDQLINYFHAKWLAMKYNLVFICEPFKYSDEFHLDSWLSKSKPTPKFEKQIEIKVESVLKTSAKGILFKLPYYPECEFGYRSIFIKKIMVDWEDPIFRKEMKKCLTPREKIKTIPLPTDMITVGVHVRRGSGRDKASYHNTFPLKFPTDRYYIEQIRRLGKIFKDQKLYVFILTDDLNPQKIVDDYTKKLDNSQFVLDCRKEGVDSPSCFLEDFVSLRKFDCMIICQSNFSLIQTKVKDYKVLVTPMHAVKHEGEWVVDDVEVLFNGTK